MYLILFLIFALFLVWYIIRFESFESSVIIQIPLQLHYLNSVPPIGSTVIDSINSSLFSNIGIQFSVSGELLDSFSTVRFPDPLELDFEKKRFEWYMTMINAANFNRTIPNIYFVPALIEGHGTTFTPEQLNEYLSDHLSDYRSLSSFAYCIFISTERSTEPDKIALTCAHELGHVLGLRNIIDPSANPSNLMYDLSNSSISYLLTPYQRNTAKQTANSFARTFPKPTIEFEMPFVNYHLSEEQIRINEDAPQNFIDIFNDNGKPIRIPRENAQPTPTYYKPGSYPFGSANYVPNYADSILLSSLHRYHKF